ncbi:MAG: 30S ribosomal protein S4 [Candidatus Woesebacteria bacterium GW2011_GWC2_47_16]|uniref:Small ribosomal subunit protein uS4 n=9 Tax=Candidatus Woeseibacteriota TaxID=1752722 RepID=A0A0G1SZJ6_9BACT|nr:MAG: 30S ribosomal protein S4 [Candidatus Woesebacteria bacterium GW2011_GWE1_45_18]KKU23856.1 MAG: 30S ribosomal protein S4 [Candidatus Woesebacteria bacterium GW2011_GWF1_46_13]KKU47368.1 MAG: 30S ribosomal protein S4 [Candidatus Woesebacteria bacterium GW2011_GWF2_46_8]KKU63053.1 MAG: 30S ribosomal protein S4 [Candidatus Woesebacteria bacterium GW2011_GWC2_47_16]KKU70025.1 MAG: 30S ribosomal protein S4 [Candidatus Woesebacteria bacterium GW2011_GWD1_47_21]OGM78797.1 MAG: 30S ribosomal pr
MARYTGAKDRLSRREGFDLFGKGAKLTRLAVPPGVHGPKGIRMRSQYGRQLREKQKVKRLYGILERQFKRYIEEALKTKGNTGETLLSLLERRLDNVVFRLGFAVSRPSARQFVSHRHVLVNGKRLNIPSYQVRAGEAISLSSEALNIPSVKEALKEKDRKIPDWLKRKAAVGMITREPKMEDILEPINVQDIVEFYSR